MLEIFSCSYLSSNSDLPVMKAFKRYPRTSNKISLKIILVQFRKFQFLLFWLFALIPFSIMKEIGIQRKNLDVRKVLKKKF